MRLLTKQNIQSIFSMPQAIAACKQALSLYSAGNTTTPLRTVIDIPKQQAQSLFMPAYVDELNATGIKIVSIYPNNPKLNKPVISAQMLLLDENTGEVCAMMDGTYLTQLRTGALQGAATDSLANQDAKIAVLFGTGGQAPTQLEAMLNVRTLTEVRVIGGDFSQTQNFVTAMQNAFPQFNHTKIIAVDIAERDDAINDADIITAVTTAKNPVFNGAFVKPGAHINGIGAYLPDMQELPAEIFQRADKIYFDTNEGVLSEAGDILIPLKNNLIQKTDFTGELGELILKKTKGRESDQEITVFKAVGSAVLDVVIAQQTYQQALAMNIGQTISI